MGIFLWPVFDGGLFASWSCLPSARRGRKLTEVKVKLVELCDSRDEHVSATHVHTHTVYVALFP